MCVRCCRRRRPTRKSLLMSRRRLMLVVVLLRTRRHLSSRTRTRRVTYGRLRGLRRRLTYRHRTRGILLRLRRGRLILRLLRRLWLAGTTWTVLGVWRRSRRRRTARPAWPRIVPTWCWSRCSTISRTKLQKCLDIREQNIPIYRLYFIKKLYTSNNSF